MTSIARPRNPYELAVLLPYQLGYHPGPSVLVVAMHGRRLGMLQRHELPDEPRAAPAHARHALSILARDGASGVLLVGFEERAGQCRPLLEAMAEAADEVGLEAGHRLVVRDGHAHTVEDGRAVVHRLPRPEDVPAVAPFVHAGIYPLPSREDLVRGALPDRDEGRAAAVARAGHPLGLPPDDESLVLAWSRVLDPSDRAVPVVDLRDDELLLLASSLRDVDWRDALMAALCPGTMPATAIAGRDTDLALLACARCAWSGEPTVTASERSHDGVMRVRLRLGEVTGLVPRELTPSLLTLVGLLAWWTGDGTVAGSCLERALDVDPDHRLAGLMLDLLAQGVRPWDLAQDTMPGSAA